MPFTAFLHTHTLVVILYVLLFTVKVYLLFTNSNDILETIRKKTRIVEMILGTLILVTGIYLATKSAASAEAWFYIKLVLFVAAVVLGIIGFKKMSKLMAGIALLCFIAILLLSYIKPGSAVAHPVKNAEVEPRDTHAPGYDPYTYGGELYHTMNCAACHGDDGTLALSGAKDLQKSTLSTEQIKETIMHGRNLMPSYEGKLDKDQQNALAEYVVSLRK